MIALVTGCAGFIGSHLCERLIERGDTVTGIDLFTSYYDETFKRKNLERLQGKQKFTLVEGDLVTTDLTPLVEAVDCVFHTAGQPGVRGSWGEQFDLYTRNNILATQRLLENIKTCGAKCKVIYSSSSSVYGNTDELPTTENALPRPYSPYGTTKLAAEHLCMLYQANYGIPTVSLRYFTVYGPRQRPDMAFHIFSRSVLQDQPITILGDGKQTRDFTYVDDIVDANLTSAEKKVEGKIMNLGGGSRTSINQVLDLLKKISGKEPKVIRKEAIKGDVRDTWADTKAAQKHIDFFPQVSLEEGLTREVEWARIIYSDGS